MYGFDVIVAVLCTMRVRYYCIQELLLHGLLRGLKEKVKLLEFIT